MFLKTPWLFPLLTLVFGAVAAWFLLAPQASTQAIPSSQIKPTSNSSLKPSSSPEFHLIRGSFVIIGKQPDGDSVRFIADDTGLFSSLKNHNRIKFSKDNSVQLRFEAIDAPELHYLGQAQPLGDTSRDALLKQMGFDKLGFKADNATVTAATPATVRGAVLSNAVEVNGRPISYVLLGKDANGFKDGALVKLTNALLQKTLNTKQLLSGMAYYTVYSSTPEVIRVFLRGIATQAKNTKQGIWAQDKSTNFKLENKNSINQYGVLVLPKLFRRCVAYFNAKAKNPGLGSIIDWMQASQNTSIPEDDLVKTKGQTVRLSSLLRVNGSEVQFVADTLEIVFVEK